jgi:hypothetical protein
MALSDKAQLARWRQIGARHSEKVVELAPKVLSAGAAGEDEWAVREQLAFAALDMGMVEWATVSSVSRILLCKYRADVVGSAESTREAVPRFTKSRDISWASI